MKIKLTLERPGGEIDLVLTADADATVGDVAAAITAREPGRLSAPRDDRAFPQAGGTLAVVTADRLALDPDVPLGDSGIKSGARIALSAVSSRYAAPGRAARRDRHRD